MTDAFAKQMDEMIAGAKDTEPAPAPAAEAAPAPQPEDPLAPWLGRSDEDVAQDRRDPFAAMLDAMLAEQGRSASEEVVKSPDADQHEWEADRDAVFAGDAYRVTCKKCCRTMEASREETLGQSMQRHQISSDCGLQLVSETMSS